MCNDESPLAVFHLEGNYAVPQGADWDVAILYKENNAALDFSTATARMQVRKDYDKEIILELNSADGSITLGDGTGDTPNVTLKFQSAVTSAMTQYEGIYDLEVTTNAGVVKKFLEGRFQLRREVTK
jgi:hypothetical protein